MQDTSPEIIPAAKDLVVSIMIFPLVIVISLQQKKNDFYDFMFLGCFTSLSGINLRSRLTTAAIAKFYPIQVVS